MCYYIYNSETDRGQLTHDCEGYGSWVYCENDRVAFGLCISSSFLFIFEVLLMLALMSWIDTFIDGIRVRGNHELLSTSDMSGQQNTYGSIRRRDN